MPETPWWGIPVVAGLFALGGVVFSQIITLLLDRSKTRKEDARRWLADRRKLYVDFLAECGQAAFTIGTADGKDEGINNQVTNLVHRFSEIEILAGPSVYHAASDLMIHLQRGAGALSKGHVDDEWVDRLERLRDNLLTMVRKELGVEMPPDTHADKSGAALGD
jgi:hypothetical protein